MRGGRRTLTCTSRSPGIDPRRRRFRHRRPGAVHRPPRRRDDQADPPLCRTMPSPPHREHASPTCRTRLDLQQVRDVELRDRALPGRAAAGVAFRIGQADRAAPHAGLAADSGFVMDDLAGSLRGLEVPQLDRDMDVLTPGAAVGRASQSASSKPWLPGPGSRTGREQPPRA